MDPESSIICNSNAIYCLMSEAQLNLGFAQGTGVGALFLMVIAVVALNNKKVSFSSLTRLLNKAPWQKR